jgi:hypothetical protein
MLTELISIYGAHALFAAMAIYGVVLPVIGKAPVKLERSKAHNNFFSISMLTAVRIKKTKQDYDGVFAHEVGEFTLRWFISLGVGYSIYLATGNPFAILAVFLTGLALDTLLYAQVDLIGRAIEVQVADQDGYLAAEAGRLIKGTRGNFKGQNAIDVARMIERRNWIARPLIALLKRNWS